MFEKLRKAASARRQAKRERALERIEGELEAKREGREPTAAELEDYNELTRTGPMLGSGGGGSV